MRVSISMQPDEMHKARDCAIEVLSKLAPYDADVAKALENMLTDDYVGRLPEAIRAMLLSASACVDHELGHVEATIRQNG